MQRDLGGAAPMLALPNCITVCTAQARAHVVTVAWNSYQPCPHPPHRCSFSYTSVNIMRGSSIWQSHVMNRGPSTALKSIASRPEACGSSGSSGGQAWVSGARSATLEPYYQAEPQVRSWTLSAHMAHVAAWQQHGMYCSLCAPDIEHRSNTLQQPRHQHSLSSPHEACHRPTSPVGSEDVQGRQIYVM